MDYPYELFKKRKKDGSIETLPVREAVAENRQKAVELIKQQARLLGERLSKKYSRYELVNEANIFSEGKWSKEKL